MDDLDRTLDAVLEDFLEAGVVTIVGERDGEFVWALTDQGRDLSERQLKKLIKKLEKRRRRKEEEITNNQHRQGGK